MYFGGSVVGKASTIGIEIAYPSTNFHRGQKVRKLASFKTSLNFKSPAFENAPSYTKSETKVQCRDYRPMSLPSLVKLGPRTPVKSLSVLPTPEITQENVLNRLAVDYSISLKFYTEFKRMTPELL